ncbi:MAG TPA: 2TM domain-containing protein [Actinomycetota bacterium]
MPADAEARAYDAAKRRADELQGFYIHLTIYALVNLGLFAINAITRGDGGAWWFYWPLMGWGIGILIHAGTTFLGVFSPAWRDRKAQQLYEREHHKAA